MQSPDSQVPRRSDDEPDPALVDELFDRLIDEPEPARRVALADESVDAGVRTRVRRLLGHYDDPPAELEGSVVQPPVVPTEATGRLVGPYTIRGMIGAGAMGFVYRAEQESPRRDVALKLMRSAVTDEAGLRRFEREALLLARLQHPGIAQVYESGAVSTEAGRVAYIAMELVDGRPLGEFARSNGLDLDGRARLVANLCDAVHHAHLRGVIHRDLKPANVLVTSDGAVKVIDFGIARPSDPADEHLRDTLEGQVLGTLAYMSPEQVAGELDAIDARTDVYSLGAIAYELFSGRLPHPLSGLSIATASRQIAEEDAPRLGSVEPACRGDLEWIVARALERDAGNRYPSAAAFGDDLRRYLTGDAVVARPPTLLYQVGKLARRHRAAFVGATTTLLAVVVGAVVAVDQAIDNAILAREQTEAREDAERLEELARAQSKRAADEARDAETARALAEERANVLERITAVQSSFLRSLRPSDVAPGMRDALLSARERTLTDTLLDPELRRAALDRFAKDLDESDLAWALARGLDEGFFSPSAEFLAAELEDAPIAQAQLLSGLGEALGSMRLPDSAIVYIARAREILLEVDGGETPRTLALLLKRATITTAQSGTGDAIALIEPHAEQIEAQLRPYKEYGGYVRLHALHALSVGDFERAIELFETAATAFDQPPVVPHPPLRSGTWYVGYDALTTRADLGFALCRVGRHAEGIAHMEEVVQELLESSLDEGGLRALRLEVTVELGNALCETGESEAGERMLRDAEPECAATLGEAHTVTSALRLRLGYWLAAWGRVEEAEPYLLEAEHAIASQGLGTGHALKVARAMLVQCALRRARPDVALERAEEFYARTASSAGDRPELHLQSILLVRNVLIEQNRNEPSRERQMRIDELQAEMSELEQALEPAGPAR